MQLNPLETTRFNCIVWTNCAKFGLFAKSTSYVITGWIITTTNSYEQCIPIFANFIFFRDIIPWEGEHEQKKIGHIQIMVPLFHHGIQGFYFCYLPNTISKWNKFKWEILDNSNYNNFHGGDSFSHVYVIIHKYFVKNPKMQKMNT